MSMRKIKKDDNIIVITGKNRGMQGKVLRVTGNNRLLVEGINIVKKHVKPNPQKGIQGGIVEKEAPIDISNAALINPATGQPDKVGIKKLEDGRKVRYFKSTNEVIDI
jgi:large subunit ribosomal protein L24